MAGRDMRHIARRLCILLRVVMVMYMAAAYMRKKRVSAASHLYRNI